MTVVGGIQARLGDRYGGMWLGNDVVNVDVLEPTQTDVAALQAVVPVGSILRVFSAPFSYSQLAKFSKNAADVLAGQGIAFTSIGPSPELGRVVVALSGSETVAAQEALTPAFLRSRSHLIRAEAPGSRRKPENPIRRIEGAEPFSFRLATCAAVLASR